MAKFNFTNAVAYLQGNFRYKLYYSKFRSLIRSHILEQIDFRVKFMKKECYENGTCVICGCMTTALQMADKQCDYPCYPPLMSREAWDAFKRGASQVFDGTYMWHYVPNIVNVHEKGILIRKDVKTESEVLIYPHI